MWHAAEAVIDGSEGVEGGGVERFVRARVLGVAALLELRDVLGWGETVDAPKRWNELLKFYLTLRSGVLVAEVRVAWVAESLLALRSDHFPPRATAKAKVTVPKQ